MTHSDSGGRSVESDGPFDRIQSGFDALFAVSVVEEVFEAVDFEALSDGAPYEQAVDHERLSRALGGPAGRVVAQRLVRRATGGTLAGVVGREVAGRVGSAAVRRVLERTNPEVVVRTLAEVVDTRAPEDPGSPVALDVEGIDDLDGIGEDDDLGDADDVEGDDTGGD
ncbi:hypothetical protein [Halomarina ordinaria]|uniref:Uncharacterized protein n=1 Tax=Halomarina ordinaria TaxID=3033939 RepID=A0ABD5UJ52_9EURY|nr:hypothetical protein [Halomarina sp. PSRA2]